MDDAEKMVKIKINQYNDSVFLKKKLEINLVKKCSTSWVIYNSKFFTNKISYNLNRLKLIFWKMIMKVVKNMIP